MTLLVDGQDLDLPTFVNSLVVPGGGVNVQIPRGYQQSRFILPHTGQDGMQQKVKRTMLLASYDLNDQLTLESTTMASDWTSSQQYAAAIDVATAIELRQQGQIGIYPYGQVMTDVRDRTVYQDLHLTGKAAGRQLVMDRRREGLYQRDDYQRCWSHLRLAHSRLPRVSAAARRASRCACEPLPTFDQLSDAVPADLRHR